MISFYRISGIVLTIGYWVLISLWKNMPNQIEWAFCLFLLVILGIPHGAADHLVAQQLARLQNSSFSLISFASKYLAVMVAYGIMWYFFPLASFVIFIGISIFHFGDLETTDASQTAKTGPAYFIQILRTCLLGMGILGFILSEHATEVGIILQNFNLGIHITVDALPVGFYILCILLGFQKEHTGYFINTGVTLLLGMYLPLLPAFMCYFAGCHSIYSIRVLTTSLALSTKDLYLRLLPFTVAAFVMGMVYVLMVNQQKWLAHAFIFLSILTLPHFFLMHKIIPKRP